MVLDKLVVRILFLYFSFLLLPLDAEFWKALAAIPVNGLGFYTFFYLSRYMPGVGAGLIAIVGGVVWFWKRPVWDRSRQWYFFLRGAVRVRLFIGVTAYAWIKVFPLLAPYPSLSDMNTSLGSVSAWKLFVTGMGIVPDYQRFIGCLELFAALLLLSRKIASLGAFILICSLGNALMTNLLYGGGEALYSFYLLSLAIFVFGHDAPRLYRLTIERKFTKAGRPSAVPGKRTAGVARTGIVLLVALSVWFGISVYRISASGNPKYPLHKGYLADGLYKVTRYVWNGVEHPVALYDSSRWEDVVFERWSSLSIRDRKGCRPFFQNTQEFALSDRDRTYESSGSSGRLYFDYTTDSLQHTIRMRSKNGGEQYDGFVLRYDRPDTATIILSGGSRKDSLYVELKKIRKIYLLDRSFEEAKSKTY